MRFSIRFLLPLAVLFCAPAIQAQSRRLVILKVDGLPGGLIQRCVSEIDSDTGKWKLPWIRHVFVEQGTVIRNFYTRGISLSSPSWCLLDTGSHAIIRSNAEFDRLTGRVYDYINFFPFYLNYARSRRADMPGVEVLDEAGIPLILDRYPVDERYQGFQLYQRGVRWSLLGRGLKKGFLTKNPLHLFSEWLSGFDAIRNLTEQMELEFLDKLQDSRLLYLDYFDVDYDHVAHLSNSRSDQEKALVRLDTLVGKIWSTIQKTALAERTVFVIVSDHGMNSEEGVYSQGYSLLDLFRSGAGGGHHVLMNRHPLGEYKLKGLDPFVSEVITSSQESAYLRDKAKQYPTAIMDLDGNERASIHLRNSDWNIIHILLQELGKRDLQSNLRRAAGQAVIDTIDMHRQSWNSLLAELSTELPRLGCLGDFPGSGNPYFSPKGSEADRAAGREQQARRRKARMESCQKNEKGYQSWAKSLEGVLKLDSAALESGRIKADSLIPERIMADANTIYQLQNYVTGPGPEGLVLSEDGILDMAKSFRRVDYFKLLSDVRVRNVVQAGFAARPVDFIAVRVPLETLRKSLPIEHKPDMDGIWIYGDEQHQILLIFRRPAGGAMQARYIPVGRLRQDRSGMIEYDKMDWGPGFPLRFWEDIKFGIASDDREAWLDQWHSESEWMNAAHYCLYSNAVIGLHEYFLSTLPEEGGNPATLDEQPARRFERRIRRMVQADLLVLANNHWNFNVRGFNPGGNHGSFFRISTHSVFMLGGAGIPKNLTVDRPYDSLSFAPTLMVLAGKEPAGKPSWALGPLIEEILPSVAASAAGHVPEKEP
jgi:hypothetical protein